MVYRTTKAIQFSYIRRFQSKVGCNNKSIKFAKCYYTSIYSELIISFFKKKDINKLEFY